MKVLFFQYMFQNDGSTNALYKLVDYLSSRDCEIMIIYSRRSAGVSQFKDIGVKCIQIPYLMSSDRGYKGIFRYIYICLYVIVNSIAIFNMLVTSYFFKPDVIHTNVSPIQVGYFLAKLLHIPHIWHIREFKYRNASSQPIFNFSYFIKLLNSSATIATTKAIKDYYGLARCKVIYDGVINNSSHNELTPLNERLKSFLFVGRVEKSKGIEMLINSFAKFAVNNADWRLDIVGGYSANYYSDLIRKIKILNIENRVHFLGPRSDVDALMAKRKVVVISSLSEGFGYVTVEAMNNKCFVIANNNTGTKEQLDNARNIAGKEIAYRFTNEEELLEQMRRVVLEDELSLQVLVDDAYDIVRNLYGITRYGSEVSNYYEQMIKLVK